MLGLLLGLLREAHAAVWNTGDIDNVRTELNELDRRFARYRIEVGQLLAGVEDRVTKRLADAMKHQHRQPLPDPKPTRIRKNA